MVVSRLPLRGAACLLQLTKADVTNDTKVAPAYTSRSGDYFNVCAPLSVCSIEIQMIDTTAILISCLLLVYVAFTAVRLERQIRRKSSTKDRLSEERASLENAPTSMESSRWRS
jgi:hypothetical protein